MASDLYDRMCGRVHRKYALYCLLQMARNKIYRLEIPNDNIREYLDILRIQQSRAEQLQSDFEWIFDDRVQLNFDGSRLESLILYFPGFYGQSREYEQRGWKNHRVTFDDKLFNVNELIVTVMLDLMEEHGF